MFEMLKHMPPPLGLGKRCPARVAYKVPACSGCASCSSHRGLSVCLSATLLSHCAFLCPATFPPSQTEGHRPPRSLYHPLYPELPLGPRGNLGRETQPPYPPPPPNPLE